MSIKVLLADDSDVMRSAIRRILEDEPRIVVVGEAATFAKNDPNDWGFKIGGVAVGFTHGREASFPAGVGQIAACMCLRTRRVFFK
jgi:predicted component of type VI protein secretion system